MVESVLLLLCSLSALGLPALLQENQLKDAKAKKNAEIEIQADGVIERTQVPPFSTPEQFPKFRVLSTVPPLTAGSSATVNLSITNPFNEAVQFTQVRASCSCMKFTIDSGEFPRNSTTTVVAKLKVPQSTLSGDVVSVINLHDRTNGKHIAEIIMRYEVLGNIAVAAENVFIEIDKANPIKSTSVPVHISEPVTFDDLKLSVSPNLRDIPMELVRDGNGISILIEASFQNLDGGGIGGEVRVESKSLGNGAGFYLAVNRHSVIRLSPASLHFRRQEPNDSVQVATAIMRISPPRVENPIDTGSEEPEIDEASRIPKPQVSLHFDGEKLSTQVIPIGKSGVFKIIVKKVVETEPSSAAKLVWKINWKDEVLATQADAFFEDMN